MYFNEAGGKANYKLISNTNVNNALMADRDRTLLAKYETYLISPRKTVICAFHKASPQY